MDFFKECGVFIDPEIAPEYQDFPDMKGKKLAVMGGSRGIGRWVADFSSMMGAEVAVVSRKPEEMPYYWISADLDEPQIIPVVWEMIGNVDYIFNNAGYYFTKTIAETSTEEWNEVIARNLTNMFHLIKHGLGHLNPGGVMVNMSSRPFLDKYYAWSAYTLAKMGVTILTKSAAEEGKKERGTHAYSVCPSRVDTAFRDAVFPDEDKRTRLSPDEAATVIMYLFNRKLPNGQHYWIKKIYGS